MATKKANLKKSSKTAHKKVTEEISKVEKTVKAIVKNDKKTDTIFLEEISKPSFISAVALEFIGTFLLAAGIIISQGQPIGVMFILMSIVLIAGGVSGAHVNPLITIGAWATRRINTIKAIFLYYCSSFRCDGCFYAFKCLCQHTRYSTIIWSKTSSIHCKPYPKRQGNTNTCC